MLAPVPEWIFGKWMSKGCEMVCHPHTFEAILMHSFNRQIQPHLMQLRKKKPEKKLNRKECGMQRMRK